MEFRFIDNNVRPDRQSLRLIRSHAMKGKNLGRIIPDRGRKNRQHQESIPSSWPASAEENLGCVSKNASSLLFPDVLRAGTPAAEPNLEDVPAPTNPFSGSEYLYFDLPVQMTPSMRFLFTQLHNAVREDIYPPLFCRPSNESVAPGWFEHIIGNPSAFHCAIAMTAAYVSLFRGHRDDTHEALRHFSQALRLLRQDLGEPTTPRAPSLVVVVSLAMYANMTGCLSESRVHLDGLQCMVELHPGGLAALRVHVRELANKIRRADVELALLTGERTCFAGHHEPGPSARSVAPAIFGPRSDGGLPHPLDQMREPLKDVTRDVLALCRCAGAAQLDAYQYQDVVISILQRLVDCAPLSAPRPPHPVDDLAHLGLVAFMLTILYPNGRVRATYSPLLAELVRVRLDAYANEESPVRSMDGHMTLCLWLVFFYAFSALEDGQRHDDRALVAWYVRVGADSLGVTTWADARVYLSTFPWVAAMHDSPGKKLWDSVYPSSGPG